MKTKAQGDLHTQMLVSVKSVDEDLKRKEAKALSRKGAKKTVKLDPIVRFYITVLFSIFHLS